jgi:hypothetical protein
MFAKSGKRVEKVAGRQKKMAPAANSGKRVEITSDDQRRRIAKRQTHEK